MMRVRVRLGAGLARLADAPLLALELPEAATVATLLDVLASRQPGLAAALPSVLPVVKGVHADRGDVLQDGTEVAPSQRSRTLPCFAHLRAALLGPVADGGHIVVNTAPG